MDPMEGWVWGAAEGVMSEYHIGLLFAELAVDRFRDILFRISFVGLALVRTVLKAYSEPLDKCPAL